MQQQEQNSEIKHLGKSVGNSGIYGRISKVHIRKVWKYGLSLWVQRLESQAAISASPESRDRRDVMVA